MTASLLPNGKQQFFNANGSPLAGGSVYFYVPSTTTPKDTWQDSGQITLNANPVILDAAGEAVIYGSGRYRQIVKDSAGNLVWDEPTSAPLNAGSAIAATLTGYISSGVAIDGSTPNSVLDVAAFSCADSTNTTMITGGPLTKSTSGPWVAGTGQGGMGNGLTVQASTTYHLLAIINGGSADVYYDTSPSAANAPTGTTAYRRLWSFKTDGSAHIIPFLKTGSRCDLFTPILELNGAPGVTTAVTQTLTAVPAGIVVHARITGGMADSGGISQLYISALAQTDLAPSNTAYTCGNPSAGTVGTYAASITTNQSAQIRRRVSSTTTSITITCVGWDDPFIS